MSEHSAGSDVVSMKTTAKSVDGGWVLNGTKMWITNVSQGLFSLYTHH
jgi:alkylation response protein AidB-like acyl-CoA dehydrogenase